MNKLLFVALIAITSLSLTSCGTYNSARDSNAATRGGVSSSMLGKIGTILIQDLGSSVLPKSGGASSMLGKLNMGTKLNNVVKGAGMVNNFKSMLSNNYDIPSTKVDNAYGKFGTLKDVASFIGQNAGPSFLAKVK